MVNIMALIRISVGDHTALWAAGLWDFSHFFSLPIPELPQSTGFRNKI